MIGTIQSFFTISSRSSLRAGVNIFPSPHRFVRLLREAVRSRERVPIQEGLVVVRAESGVTPRHKVTKYLETLGGINLRDRFSQLVHCL